MRLIGRVCYFSIIVPVFNRVDGLEECLESLLGQTFIDYEVILVDDGSDESVYACVTKLCEQDKRIHCVRHETNKSTLVARYTGLKEANGEYILFVDSDDTLSLNALEHIYDKLKISQVDILRFGHKEVYHENLSIKKCIDEKDRVIVPIDTDNPLRAMLTDQMAPNVWKNCYNRRVVSEALERFTPFFCNICDDVYWSTLLLSCAKSDDTLKECLYYYNIGSGISTNHTNNQKEKLAEYIKQIKLCVDTIRKYFQKYEPDYVGYLGNKYQRMNRFLLLTFAIDESDLCKVVDYIKLFDTDELQPIYSFGCNIFLPFKVRLKYHITDEVLTKIGVWHKAMPINYLEDLMNYEI